MSRKKPALKFHAPNPPQAAADGFVRGGRAVKTARLQDTKTARQQTVYLPEDLKMRLHRYSVDHKLSVSEAVQRAVEAMLSEVIVT